MRILHVVPSYLPAVRYGGPIFAVHGLCRALASRGHEVQVFTTNIDGPGVTSTPIATPVDLDGLQIRYFTCPLLRRLYWSPALGRAPSSRGRQIRYSAPSFCLSVADMGGCACSKKCRHSLLAVASRHAS
jgi:hypothetical protein